VSDAGGVNRQFRRGGLEQDLGDAALPGDREELVEKHVSAPISWNSRPSAREVGLARVSGQE
jgi:hypothetical protein